MTTQGTLGWQAKNRRAPVGVLPAACCCAAPAAAAPAPAQSYARPGPAEAAGAAARCRPLGAGVVNVVTGRRPAAAAAAYDIPSQHSSSSSSSQGEEPLVLVEWAGAPGEPPQRRPAPQQLRQLGGSAPDPSPSYLST